MSSIKLQATGSPFRSPSLSKFRSHEEALASAFGGDMLVVTETDRRFIEKYGKQLCQNVETVSTIDVLAWCLESLLISYLNKIDPDPSCVHLMEKIMRQYELKSYLVSTYDAVYFKPVTEARFQSDGYLLFSCALLIANLVTKDLRFLNTLLKVEPCFPQVHTIALKIVEAL